MAVLNKRKYTGFTMIELVMVIVIIGILAAAALPRFANLNVSAQTASNQGTAGALRAAVGIAHASWIAAGASAAASTVTLDSQGISLNTSGWPDAAMVVTATAAGCNTVFSTLLQNPPQSAATTGAGLTETPAYVATAAGAVCTYTMYAASTAVSPPRTITYTLTSGAVGVT